MSYKALHTLLDRSESLDLADNGELRSSLYYHATRLYRHRDGKYFVIEEGGGATIANRQPQWITRDVALQFVRLLCSDPVTGYAYTDDQCEGILDGRPVVPGNGYGSRNLMSYSQRHDVLSGNPDLTSTVSGV